MFSGTTSFATLYSCQTHANNRPGRARIMSGLRGPRTRFVCTKRSVFCSIGASACWHSDVYASLLQLLLSPSSSCFWTSGPKAMMIPLSGISSNTPVGKISIACTALSVYPYALAWIADEKSSVSYFSRGVPRFLGKGEGRKSCTPYT